MPEMFIKVAGPESSPPEGSFCSREAESIRGWWSSRGRGRAGVEREGGAVAVVPSSPEPPPCSHSTWRPLSIKHSASPLWRPPRCWGTS